LWKRRRRKCEIKEAAPCLLNFRTIFPFEKVRGWLKNGRRVEREYDVYDQAER
jgi:hypothetical protein